jgi:hypothetical protein
MKKSNGRLLRLIAVFKFLKAAMLIALGVGAFRLLHKDVGDVVEHWAEALRKFSVCHVVPGRGDRIVVAETLGRVAYRDHHEQPGTRGDL